MEVQLLEIFDDYHIQIDRKSMNVAREHLNRLEIIYKINRKGNFVTFNFETPEDLNSFRDWYHSMVFTYNNSPYGLTK